MSSGATLALLGSGVGLAALGAVFYGVSASDLDQAANDYNAGLRKTLQLGDTDVAPPAGRVSFGPVIGPGFGAGTLRVEF